MIIDNDNSKLKVYEWIAKYNEEGNLDVVTGYFTIGALAYLSKISKEKIKDYRFVLGDIVNFDEKVDALNLLNENISIDTSLKLNALAKEAVAFLKLDNVVVKTLEPNFCHAKLYLKTATADERNHYFISGSSNLTEAGIGMKKTSNVELNIAETGDGNQYNELIKWFESLWNRPQAHSKKTLISLEGKAIKKDFKIYLIEEISRLFSIYSPEQIYFKILYELFNKEINDPEAEKKLVKLEDTTIFNRLYDFQKGGVTSLIKMLNKYNGAILADAVGLGKTWSALAVMKAFQNDHKVILFCPKKLEQNWQQYLEGNNSSLEADKFEYLIRFHTDLRDGGMRSRDIKANFFSDDKKKLFVIDESHNLRNDKSSRYQYLIDEVLQKSQGEVKVLLLSATPINNSFKDVRNQFKLMTKGDNSGFKESLEVNNIEHTFKDVQKVFNDWSQEDEPKLADFHQKIKDSNFFRLTDHLLVARTRKRIQSHYNSSLCFPKHKKPINIFKTPIRFGDVESFAELMENLKLNLSAYQPSYYTISKETRLKNLKEKKFREKKGEKGEKDAILKDDVQREFFLVKMMMILMLKRLESSWFSFKITVERIYEHHDNALSKINQYQDTKAEISIDFGKGLEEEALTDDEGGLLDSFTFGKKNPISLKLIDIAGNLDDFKSAIKTDKKNLKYILDNVFAFEHKIKPEKALKSDDNKLEVLLQILKEKQESKNKKLVIFTAYKDTAEYLFEQLQNRGFEQFAMITGDESKVWNEPKTNKNHEYILQRFAPYTKLFRDKNWANFKPTVKNVDSIECFEEWKAWVKNIDSSIADRLQKPLNILIATDVLSEGQNLQDADLVINYDIHWNPVRVVQRVGRIDRIGSPNTEIQSINFWPASDIDDYINLKARVEKRMAMMKLAGSEVINDFTDDFNAMSADESLEDRQNANMLRQMENTLEDIEGEKTLGFDSFSFDSYRELLNRMLNSKRDFVEKMPNGVFSGFIVGENEVFLPGLVALLGYPAQKKYSPENGYTSYELIHIDEKGNPISNNQKVILEQLQLHYSKPRFVDPKVEGGDEETIQGLSNALRKWVDDQARTEIELEDGSVKTVMSSTVLNFMHQLKTSVGKTTQQLKSEGALSEKYDFEKFDLITWLIIS